MGQGQSDALELFGQSAAQARKCASDWKARVQAMYKDVDQEFANKPGAQARLKSTVNVRMSIMDAIARFSLSPP